MNRTIRSKLLSRLWTEHEQFPTATNYSYIEVVPLLRLQNRRVHQDSTLHSPRFDTVRYRLNFDQFLEYYGL